MKEDAELRRIPVVILTVSKAEQDILKSYNLHANCYITKPVDLDQFLTVVKSIENFWLTVVMLPPRKRSWLAKPSKYCWLKIIPETLA
jgi:chemotaxis family two-component system response regulator Rcp1